MTDRQPRELAARPASRIDQLARALEQFEHLRLIDVAQVSRALFEAKLASRVGTYLLAGTSEQILRDAREIDRTSAELTCPFCASPVRTPEPVCRDCHARARHDQDVGPLLDAHAPRLGQLLALRRNPGHNALFRIAAHDQLWARAARVDALSAPHVQGPDLHPGSRALPVYLDTDALCAGDPETIAAEADSLEALMTALSDGLPDSDAAAPPAPGSADSDVHYPACHFCRHALGVETHADDLLPGARRCVRPLTPDQLLPDPDPEDSVAAHLLASGGFPRLQCWRGRDWRHGPPAAEEVILGEIDRRIAALLPDVTEARRGLEARERASGDFFGPICPGFTPWRADDTLDEMQHLYHPTAPLITADFGSVDLARERRAAAAEREAELQRAADVAARAALARLARDPEAAQLLAARVERGDVRGRLRQHPLVRLLARELPPRAFRPGSFERVVRPALNVSNAVAADIAGALRDIPGPFERGAPD